MKGKANNSETIYFLTAPTLLSALLQNSPYIFYYVPFHKNYAAPSFFSFHSFLLHLDIVLLILEKKHRK